MNKIQKIYISGTLTYAAEKQKKIYLKISELCKPFCETVYVPHLNGTDPVKNPDVTPAEVWQKDYQEVISSDLVIAFVGEPSLGTGGELEIARMAGRDIILWRFKGQKVSRLPLGNPAVVEKIEAADETDLFEKLKNILQKRYGG